MLAEVAAGQSTVPFDASSVNVYSPRLSSEQVHTKFVPAPPAGGGAVAPVGTASKTRRFVYGVLSAVAGVSMYVRPVASGSVVTALSTVLPSVSDGGCTMTSADALWLYCVPPESLPRRTAL